MRWYTYQNNVKTKIFAQIWTVKMSSSWWYENVRIFYFPRMFEQRIVIAVINAISWFLPCKCAKLCTIIHGYMHSAIHARCMHLRRVPSRVSVVVVHSSVHIPGGATLAYFGAIAVVHERRDADVVGACRVVQRPHGGVHAAARRAVPLPAAVHGRKPRVAARQGGIDLS